MRMHKNTTETEGEKKRGNEINDMHLSAFTSTQTYLNLPASNLSPESITHYSSHSTHLQKLSASLTEATMREAV